MERRPEPAVRNGVRPVDPAWLDGAVWSLIAANALSLAVAAAAGWGALQLMAVYWGQGVIIGLVNILRILTLRRYSTEGYAQPEDKPDKPPPTRASAAGLFAAHYGLFILGTGVYLGFRMIEAHARIDPRAFWVCMLAFTLCHLWSYFRELPRIRESAPRLGDLMAMPYLRVLPMHVTIIIGAAFLNGLGGLLLWGTLRACADVAMHIVEQAQLSGSRAGP